MLASNCFEVARVWCMTLVHASTAGHLYALMVQAMVQESYQSFVCGCRASGHPEWTC
jgi:hypothetical protein